MLNFFNFSLDFFLFMLDCEPNGITQVTEYFDEWPAILKILMYCHVPLYFGNAPFWLVYALAACNMCYTVVCVCVVRCWWPVGICTAFVFVARPTLSHQVGVLSGRRYVFVAFFSSAALPSAHSSLPSSFSAIHHKSSVLSH